MLVFGDAAEQVDPRERLSALPLAAVATGDIDEERQRHWALCELFLDAAELVQGLADAAMASAISAARVPKGLANAPAMAITSSIAAESSLPPA